MLLRRVAAGAFLGSFLVGCGGDDTAGTAAATTGAPQPKQPVVDLVVDTNRDGIASVGDPADEEGKDAFDATRGASFLANLDDDDMDGVRDADDELVGGDADALDLARILVAPWADAPGGASATLTLDAGSAAYVRVFRHWPDGSWQPVLGGLGCTTPDTCNPVTSMTLDTDAVRAGVEFGIEARQLVMSAKDGAWDGSTALTLAVLDAKGKPVVSDDAPDGTDRVVMRVAPWVLFGNLSPFDVVWADGQSAAAFESGIQAGADAAGVKFNRIKNYFDQWTQDYFQTAWTGMPGPGGTVQGMRVANARPWHQDGAQLPIAWLTKNYLGPDRAVLAVYTKAHENGGTSYDSHGNHNLLPPYESASGKWPLGRIILGSGVLPETVDFYAAQRMQGPPLRVDTSWLWVGHVDEALSYVPAKTPRGWKLFVGSPKLAVAMLEKAQTDGHGAEVVFAGKKAWNAAGTAYVDASTTIDAILANVDLMQWSQEAQVHIDAMRAKVVAEVGLADDEIVEIPYLFQDEYGDGVLVAYNPGTANQLVLGDHAMMPKPFGPIIDGKDLFEADLVARLGPGSELGSEGQGLDVRFVDDWVDYHILDGEVHCGSNPEAPPPFSDVRWWETGR